MAEDNVVWDEQPQPAATESIVWDKPAVTKPSSAPTMPGIGESLLQGVGAGIGHTRESIDVLRGRKPEDKIPPSAAAAPLEWQDIYSPVSKLAPKLAYGLGEASPTLAGGILGGIAGAATPLPGGALIGGAGGAGLGAIAQSIGPVFGEELKKSPDDPDGAWSRAIKSAATSGAFSAAGWAAFPLKAPGAQTALKNIVFQAFGIQAPLAAGQQATQNIIRDQPVTEGIGPAAGLGAAMTAIPMAGHAVVSRFGKPTTSLSDRRATDPILSRIGEEGDTKFSLRGSLNRLYTAIKDDLNPANEAQKFLAGGEKLPFEDRFYELMRLTRGSQGRAEHLIDYGTFDPVTGANWGMGLKRILEPMKDDLDPFRKYIIAEHNIEVRNRGIETGIPLQESVDYVKNNAQFARPAADVHNFQNDMLRILEKGGLISKEEMKAMRDLNPAHVPFYRLIEEPDKYFLSPGAGLKVRKPVYGMKGSELPIIDPIESMIKNAYLFQALADKNISLQALERVAKRYPERGEQILKKVEPGVRPIEVTPQEIERGLGKHGQAVVPGDPEAFTIFRPNAFRPAPDEIRVFNNGKATVYKTDPYLAAVVNGLDREQFDTFTRLMSHPARWLRAGATLAPEFIVRNPVRDQFSAFIFSTLGRGYVPVLDFMHGLGGVLAAKAPIRNVPGLRSLAEYQRAVSGQEKYFSEWLKSGGANSALVSLDRNYIQNLINNLNDPTFMGSVKNLLRSPIEILRATSELMENATRVGEFKRLTKAGVPLKEAGFGSREVTLDFQRIGSKMRAANSLIAFLNAQMEGVDRAGRAFWNNPKRFTAAAVGGITVPSLYLWASQHEDPRYKEIPRWEKDMFWPILTDNWQPISAQDAAKVPKGYTRQKPDGTWEINKGNIYRIPKPFELGVMFGSIPERILDAYYDKDPKAFKNMLPTLAGAFLPNVIPQSISPVIEQFSNRSLFTSRPLVPKYLEDLMPIHQANPYTTDTAKQIGQWISSIPGLDQTKFASPIMVENYIRAWTGGLGRHALDASDAVLRAAGVAPTKVLPTLTNADKTLIKAFAIRYPEAGANSIQDFYDEYEKRSRAKKSVEYLRKSGKTEEASEVVKNNMLATAEGIKQGLGRQFKMVRDHYSNPKLSADEKRQFIDMSYLQMIKMAQTGLAVFKKTEEDFKKRKEAENIKWD